MASAGGGVHGQAVDVAVGLGENRGAAVDGLAHAVEDAAEHILAHAELQRMAEETDLGLREVDALRALEELDDGGVILDLEHLAAANLAVWQLDFGQLVIRDAFDLIDQHQRAGDLPYGLILFNHSSSPPAMISLIWVLISSRMPL